MTPRLEIREVAATNTLGRKAHRLEALAIERGEMVAVVGGADSGKSALGFALMGFDTAARIEGSFRFDGTSIHDLPYVERARRLAFVPAEPSLLFSGVKPTVRGELELSLQFLGIGPDLGGPMIERVIRRLDLAQLLERDPFTLSGGEKSLSALALALVKEPDLLVLDQPLDSLDPETVRKVLAALKAFCAEGGSVLALLPHRPDDEAGVHDFDRIELFHEDVERAENQAENLGADFFGLSSEAGVSRFQVEQLTFSYPDSAFTLTDINLSLDGGESVALVGHNGAGKTTLLKSLALLIDPQIGELTLTVPGETATRSIPREKHVHEWAKSVLYVFQAPEDQLFRATVREELEETARRIGHNEKEPRVMAVAKGLGLEPYLTTSPLELPRPMQKLVTLGSAFVASPPILLFDEPTAGLDPVAKGAVRRLMAAYVKGGGISVTVSHDMPFVRAISDKVITMSGGRIVSEGY